MCLGPHKLDIVMMHSTVYSFTEFNVRGDLHISTLYDTEGEECSTTAHVIFRQVAHYSDDSDSKPL